MTPVKKKGSVFSVIEWPLKRIKPYAGNPRKRSKHAVEKVASSIREFGWRQPIVVDEAGVILVGHTRRDAAESLGMKSAPVHVATGLSEQQKRAYRIADNRTNEETEWDEDLLSFELKGLDGFDLSLTGFDEREWNAFLRAGPVDGEDDVPEPGEAVTKRGDVWELGVHRVLCGDATNGEDVGRLGCDALLMVTDPPYGVSYDPEWRVKAAQEGHLAYAASRIGLVVNDDRTDWSEAWVLFSGNVIYCWSPPGSNSIESAMALFRSGFEIRNQIIWSKPHFPIGRGDYHYRHEPCWYTVRKGQRSNWQGDRTQTTIWEVALDKNVEGGHSTQKPVELSRRPILNHTKPGDSVYDPFLGSGSTLIAAEITNRRCYGLEIEPRYCDVIRARWEKFTGRTATLHRT
jgi:DNA modification methylase